MRSRWYGATGRRVPAIALEGLLDVGGALVLDSVENVAELEAAHAAGTPVAVRAADEAGVKAALARPEVSCVLVREAGLLELDLPELTYG